MRKQTPYEYLQKRKNINSAEFISDFLYQVDMGNKRFAIFFKNKNGNLSCAILKKDLFSYNLLKISAEILLIKTTDENGNYIFSSYQDGINYNKRKWIYWGVIHNDSIEKVLIDNKEATIVDINNYHIRLCFIFGNYVKNFIPEIKYIKKL